MRRAGHQAYFDDFDRWEAMTDEEVMDRLRRIRRRRVQGSHQSHRRNGAGRRGPAGGFAPGSFLD